MKGSPKITELSDLSLGLLTPSQHSLLKDLTVGLQKHLVTEQSDRMVPAGPSKKEEIILNVKAECGLVEHS